MQSKQKIHKVLLNKWYFSKKMKHLRISIRICFILIANIYAQNDPYFYHAKKFGSESIFNPVTTIINGGFGILQIGNRSNCLQTVDFKNGIKNVNHNLAHPIEMINEYGWHNFIFHEIVPASLKPASAQYFPNYLNHLIGGGYTYRALQEWYIHYNFSHPKILAFSSLMAYHYLNEVVENNRFVGPNIDPIADFYIFNVAGLILFSSDKIANFFGNTLSLRDWSFMPGYNPHLNSVENIGQNFIIRIKVPYTKRWRMMYHWGSHGMYGLSYNYRQKDSFSIAGGLVAKELLKTNKVTRVRELTASLVWTAGLFWDRENSLLASLILSGTKGYKARLNIYPGVIKTSYCSPGLFINLRKDNSIVFGVFFNLFPIGVSHSFN